MIFSMSNSDFICLTMIMFILLTVIPVNSDFHALTMISNL